MGRVCVYAECIVVLHIHRYCDARCSWLVDFVDVF